ncbi:MAG: putative peptidoglycan glycosyltransferase FtsW [Chlamydiales bacterium]|nr:putative peptidoglycan glycosyltransferase FtsW [Chlamydiales bacterium]
MRSLILICVILIFALGLVMVFNTSSAEILDRALDRSTHQALFRQIVYATIGLLLSILVWKVGYTHLLRLSPYLLFFATLSLVFVFVPGIGTVRNGAHRWVGIGSFTFQPSEVVKYLVPMVYIEWIVRRYKHEVSFLTFCKIVSILAIPMFLIMVEPDNGTTAVIGASLIPLFFISGIRFKYWALPVLVLLSIGTVAAFQLPYVKGRLSVYLNPELDIRGKGHQPHQAKIAAGSGKLLGRGPGASLQKLTYLPEAQNDYIAAIYAEEFGFIGILLLISLYMLLAFGGFSIAMRTPTALGCYLAMAITFLISLQAFLNLGVVSGLLPSKGVNLPFFSQGGTSLVANIIGLAVLLNVGSYEKKETHFERRRYRRASLSGTGSGPVINRL